MNKRLEATLKLGFGAAELVGGIAGIVSDFFLPIGPIGFNIGLVLLALFVVTVLLYLFPVSNNFLSNKAPTYWFLPIALFFSLSSTTTFGFYYLSKEKSDEGGFLASQFEEIRSLQERQLGLLTDIKSNTKKTAENTGKILDVVKKEISANPRKELANMGIAWKYQNFIEAISSQDSQASVLFAEGGMDFDDDDFRRYVATRDVAFLTPVLTAQKELGHDLGCPTDYQAIFLHQDIADDKERQALVKKACASKRVYKELDKSIAVETEQLKFANKHNANLGANNKKCIADLSDYSAQQYFDDALDFSPTTMTISSLRDEVLAKLNFAIITNNYFFQANRQQYINERIEEVCAKYNIAKKVDDNRLQGLIKYRQLLSD